MILLATTAMPWCAGGDRASSVWKRSLKNVYWSTTIVLPISVALAVFFNYENRIEDWMDRSSEAATIAAGLAIACAFGMFIILFIRAVLVGAHRYVGPA